MSTASFFVFAATPLSQAKNFESDVLKLICTGFNVTGTGVEEMSVGISPNNWTAATGSQWTSSNCFPANITSVAHIKQSVQFGSSLGTASAQTPVLDLSSITGKSTKVKIVLTAGSDKTGSLAVKLDGNTIGTINATGGAPGGANFGAFYYIFEYDITATGTQTSSLTFEHSSVNALGYLYIKEIAVYREPISLLKLNTQLFSANSTAILSTANYPNNWVASLGANQFSTSYCYAQNVINTSYGTGIRMGATTNAYVGTFTTNELDLASTQNYKIKFYMELLMSTIVATVETKLNMKVDGGDSQWVFNPQLDNGSNGPVTINTWIPYESEITGGTAASKITFFQTRNATESTSIYFRNLRVYREDPSFTTIHNPSQSNQINIYPNPCIDMLFTQAQRVRIYNLLGIKIMDDAVVDSKIDVSSLAKGTYIVTCSDGDGSQSTHKIVKR